MSFWPFGSATQNTIPEAPPAPSLTNIPKPPFNLHDIKAFSRNVSCTTCYNLWTINVNHLGYAWLDEDEECTIFYRCPHCRKQVQADDLPENIVNFVNTVANNDWYSVPTASVIRYALE